MRVVRALQTAALMVSFAAGLLAAPPAHAVEAVNVRLDVPAIDLTNATEVRKTATDRIQVSTAPGPDGIVRRIEVRAREGSTNWAVFALTNNSDQQIDRLIVVPHYRMQAHALRLQQNGTTLAYSGDSGPSAALAETARDADLFVCEATLLGGDLDGEPRGHLSIPEAVAAFEDSGARSLLLTHRPQELARPDGLTFAHDGLVVEL